MEIQRAADHPSDEKQGLLGLLHLESLHPLPRHPLHFQIHWLLKLCPLIVGSSLQELTRLRISFGVLNLKSGEQQLSEMSM